MALREADLSPQQPDTSTWSYYHSFQFPEISKPLSLCFPPKPVTISMEGYNYVVSLIACLKQDLQGFNGRFEGGTNKIKKSGSHGRKV